MEEAGGGNGLIWFFARDVLLVLGVLLVIHGCSLLVEENDEDL